MSTAGDDHRGRDSEITASTFNGFGVPLHVPGFFTLARELGHTFADGSAVQIGDVAADAAYRMMLAEATGRWRFSVAGQNPRR